MNVFRKWWNRRPARVSLPRGRRFRAELETLEDRVTPSLSPTDYTVAVIGSSTVAEDAAAGTIVRFTRPNGAAAANISLETSLSYNRDFNLTGASLAGDNIHSYLSFSFAAGETTHDVVFKQVNDTIMEETTFLDLWSNSTTKVATLTFTDDDLAPLTSEVIGPDPITEDGTDVVTIHYTRSGDTSTPVTVPFDVYYRNGGISSVTNRLTVTGADSPLTSTGYSDRGFFTFAAGESVHDLVIHPKNDGISQGVETIDVSVRPLSLDSRFQIADTRIISPTPTKFSLEVIGGTNMVTESDAQGKIVRFTRHDGSTAAASDSVSVFGFAKRGVDFTLTGADSFDGNHLAFSFAAGETTHDVVFTPIQDTIMEGGTGLFFGTTLENQITTLGFLDDDHIPMTVDLIGANPIIEGGSDVLTLHYTRSGDTSAPLTVPFNLSGDVHGFLNFTFTGMDSFSNLDGFFTFAAGEATHDLVIHPTGPVVGFRGYSVFIGPIYLDASFEMTGSASPSNPIVPPPTTPPTPPAPASATNFSLEVIGSITVAENAAAGTIVRFTRHDGSTAAASDSVDIGYNTVEFGADFSLTGADSYTTNKLSFSFADGETTHDVVFMPINNTIMEPPKALVFSNPRGPNYAPTLFFGDDDRPPLNVELIGPNPLSEEGTDALTVRYSRSGDTSMPLTVPFMIGGGVVSPGFLSNVAITGVDSYTERHGFFTFAAGESVHDLVIHPIDDARPYGLQTCNIHIDPIALDTSFKINDADIPNIHMSLSKVTVTEDGGDTIVVTFKRSGNLATDSTVRFHLSGSAKRNVDYTITGAPYYFIPGMPYPDQEPGKFYPMSISLSSISQHSPQSYGVVYFPAGSDTATFVIHPTPDTLDEPNESIVISIDISSGQQYTADVVVLGATIVGNPNLPPPSSYQDELGFTVHNNPPPSDGNPGPGDNPSPQIMPPALSAPELAIESLYVNLLGRPSESTGRAGWLSQYNAGTPMKDIVLGFEQSREYAEKFLREKYQQILSRPPETEGLAFWSAKIMAGESTDAVTRAILLSFEGTQQMSSNAYFVTRTYLTLLGREADVSAAGWIQGLDSGGTRAAFVQGVIDSREARDRRTGSAYQTYLHRAASVDELSSWDEFLSGSGATPSKLLADLLNGDEFLIHA